MRRWLAWPMGAALLFGAWLVAQVTPTEDADEAPFVVPAVLGEEARGRSLTVTVTDVRLAEHVSAGGWAAEGVWLVVDLDAAATQEEDRTYLGGASLVIGGRTYRASERPASLFQQPLLVGIPRAGSLAFELPPGAVDEPALLHLSGDWETRLDSLIELPLDLAALDLTESSELAETGWARP
ncbi:DUF4352 domain-containing protein [Microbacterium lushaniae]|uniref:DUF4352 domain-containing protein n=1 Tax=Microbacterium lushaniae TaxID=2614639 RepID=A0A5J6L7L5_9MICO|nr:DUF4352 domain-containing protein [Microbacterium lushaniae]QEW04417.1 DUF4352 domain-containing protein [Microbacterium lushaniae]